MHDIKTNSQSVSQNNQKRLILGGSIVAVVTLVMLTTIPLCKAINQKKELLKQYSVNMAYEKNIKNDHNVTDVEIERLNRNIHNQEQKLFSLAELDAFSMTTLPTIASRHGVGIDTVVFLPSNTNTFSTSEYRFSFECKATFTALIQFISDIEKIEKLINIEELQIDKQAKGEDLLSATISMVLLAHQEDS